MKARQPFRRNRWGDYVAGDWCLVRPRFDNLWTITRAGVSQGRAATLREAASKTDLSATLKPS